MRLFLVIFQTIKSPFGVWHASGNTPVELVHGDGPKVSGNNMANRALKRIWAGFFAVVTMLAPFSESYAATARIKDIVDIEGVRDNQLVGYGLVVGLNGTGDSLNNSPFTRQSLQAMLERLGVNTRGENMRTANVAAVMVTANLPAFSTQGSRIDVNVAALGDAKSLQGGTLLVGHLLEVGDVFAKLNLVGEPRVRNGLVVQVHRPLVRNGLQEEALLNSCAENAHGVRFLL